MTMLYHLADVKDEWSSKTEGAWDTDYCGATAPSLVSLFSDLLLGERR